MTTNNIKNEDISALMDGESSAQCDDAFIQGLRLSKNRESWNAYHQIGDALRSEEMTNNCSAAFNAALFERLAAEPAYLGAGAPSTASTAGFAFNKEPQIVAARRRLICASRVVSGIAAASAAIYFGSTLMGDTSAKQAGLNEHLAMQSGGTPELVVAQSGAAEATSSSAVVMRDSRIDAYLIAHQRFSPFLYSTAQFARSASFVADAVK